MNGPLFLLRIRCGSNRERCFMSPRLSDLVLSSRFLHVRPTSHSTKVSWQRILEGADYERGLASDSELLPFGSALQRHYLLDAVNFRRPFEHFLLWLSVLWRVGRWPA